MVDTGEESKHKNPFTGVFSESGPWVTCPCMLGSYNDGVFGGKFYLMAKKTGIGNAARVKCSLAAQVSSDLLLPSRPSLSFHGFQNKATT